MSRGGNVRAVAGIEVRAAVVADLPQIAAVALATGQDEEWAGADPAYMTHLLAHGSVVVAVTAGSVVGFGATRQLGSGPDAVSMLCDLFVRPQAHGSGYGRAMLDRLWPGSGGRGREPVQAARFKPARACLSGKDRRSGAGCCPPVPAWPGWICWSARHVRSAGGSGQPWAAR